MFLSWSNAAKSSSYNATDADDEMDKVILPQKILSIQICSECGNYLSVGPVMVSPRKKVCGRCTKQDQTDAHSSLYDQIAASCLFKCINHYAGCREVLTYNEAVEHEKVCKKEDFKCPYCKFKGNGCQLVHHFVKQHPKFTSMENNFMISLNVGANDFVFTKNNDIVCISITKTESSMYISNFLVTYKYSNLQSLKLIFFSDLDSSIQLVTDHELNNDQDFYRKLGNFFLGLRQLLVPFSSGKCCMKVKFVADKTNHEETSQRLRYLMKTKSSKGNVKQKVGVTKHVGEFHLLSSMDKFELKQFVCNKLNDLQVCVTCDGHLRTKSDIYFCPQHHLACKNCTYKKCPKCNNFCQWTMSKFDHLSLACDWEGCSEQVNIFEFLVHKQRCQYRQYQCPDVNCRYTAQLTDFRRHWHMAPYISENMIALNANEAFYCLIPFLHEFVYITVETVTYTIFKNIVINVNEEQVVLRNAYDLELYCTGSSISDPLLKWENFQTGVGRTMSVPYIRHRSETCSLRFKKKF